MRSWFIGATLLSFATCAIHVVAGGRFVAQPLLQANDLARIAKFTNYYCWHLVTIVLLTLPPGPSWQKADSLLSALLAIALACIAAKAQFDA